MRIHTLLGAADLNISCRCLRSVLDFCVDDTSLTIHEDGTLEESGRHQLISALFPTVPEFVDKQQADTEITRILANHPWCLRYRNSHPLGIKLFDIPLLSHDARLIFIDSDVFFHRPFTMVDVVATDTPMWMMTDSGNAYAFDWKRYFLLKCRHPLSGFRLPETANSGFFSLNQAEYSLDLLEAWLSKPLARRLMRFWPRLFEQTLWAMILANRGGRLLDVTQIMIPPPGGVSVEDMPSLVGLHYVGGSRHMIPTDGKSTFGNAHPQCLRLRPMRPFPIHQHLWRSIRQRLPFA